MGDSIGNVVQQRVGDLLDGSGHSVLGVYGANDGGPAFVATLILNANALDIGNGNEILPNLFAQTVLCKFLAKDGVSFTQSEVCPTAR